MKIPVLNKGEVYPGAIINPDGTGHHIILLDGDNDATLLLLPACKRLDIRYLQLRK